MGTSLDEWVGLKPESYLPAIYGFAMFQVVATLARLNIPDVLGESAMTAQELAAETGADPASLRRLLRTAAVIGVCGMPADGRFAMTALGRMFRRDSPWQAGTASALNSAPAIWQAWGALEGAVRTGKPAFDSVHGVGLFDYLQQDAGLSELFHATMASGTGSQLAAIVERYDFSRFGHVVDVGGGDGTQLSAVLGANPQLHGTLFDTEQALRKAPDLLKRAGVADRCAVVSGNFFESVPAGGDAYLLKNVLTDWDDESSVRILRSCHAALTGRPDGRVVVITSLMPERIDEQNRGETMAVSLFDLSLLVLTPGRERTLGEYEQLLAATGFELDQVTPIAEHNLCHALDAVAVR
ncbi:hypothetical protein JOF56_007634 [Kibdelosporangium banguiense]|uniref:O-methyltransferase n=1 Tax=Kibdelosporangium banguiense TaxID=1365924 RepID=A0ABS4TTB4_9PSEU|nr:methyltransferase [Kibdelosporangium banguiense]MBP2327249.1 hypothetical protein [Kibdelosporangium banguiense]